MKRNAHDQYRNAIFAKLSFNFHPGKKILDVGCGDGEDAKFLAKQYDLDVYGLDVYRHKNIGKIKNLSFKKGSIFKLPYKKDTFDYVFLHDVLHHIDEERQRYEKHIAGLKEVKRVCKKRGFVIIVEGNRYNPLFYPHMVKMLGHEHFPQKYFNKIVLDVFPNAKFKYFEAHLYPRGFIKLFKLYEFIMEKIPFFAPFLAYNVAIIKNDK